MEIYESNNIAYPLLLPGCTNDSAVQYRENDNSFYDGDVEIVRSEFISENDDTKPMISFTKYRLHVNMVCIKLLPDTEYVQFLINKTKKLFAIKPCSDDDRDSIRWKTISRKRGQEVSRSISGSIFSAMLFDHMGWNTDYRYFLTGRLMKARDSELIVFELNSYKAQGISSSEKDTDMKKHCIYPASWKDCFGSPLEEAKSALTITTFKDYAVLNISDHKDDPINGSTEMVIQTEEGLDNEETKT